MENVAVPRGTDWFNAFVDRLHQAMPNVSPITLSSVQSSVWGDADLRELPGNVAAERWLARANHSFFK